MPFIEPTRHECFTRQLDKLISKFKNSKKTIVKQIDSILKKPLSASVRIPGFGELHMRKLRLGLKEYRIGKSGGIRIIYMIDVSNKWILMVSAYFKRDNKTEREIQSMIKENLKSILNSL